MTPAEAAILRLIRAADQIEERHHLDPVLPTPEEAEYQEAFEQCRVIASELDKVSHVVHIPPEMLNDLPPR